MSARIVLTGAASGIGAAAAAELRARGARVVGLDLSSEGEGLTECDVRDQDSVDRAIGEATAELGGLDVVINNAGIGGAQDAAAPPDERSLAILDVNLLGAWRVTSAAMPALLDSGGRVINVASGLAHLAIPFAAAYCASKRGLTAYSDSLRLEYGSRITVTTVYPGYIRTPIHEDSSLEGISLEGLIPAEELQDAARTLARAALDRPTRNLATTRVGGAEYALLRLAPRRLVHEVVDWRVRRHARSGGFEGSRVGRAYGRRVASSGSEG